MRSGRRGRRPLPARWGPALLLSAEPVDRAAEDLEPHRERVLVEVEARAVVRRAEAAGAVSRADEEEAGGHLLAEVAEVLAPHAAVLGERRFADDGRRLAAHEVR